MLGLWLLLQGFTGTSPGAAALMTVLTEQLHACREVRVCSLLLMYTVLDYYMYYLYFNLSSPSLTCHLIHTVAYPLIDIRRSSDSKRSVWIERDE